MAVMSVAMAMLVVAWVYMMHELGGVDIYIYLEGVDKQNYNEYGVKTKKKQPRRQQVSCQCMQGIGDERGGDERGDGDAGRGVGIYDGVDIYIFI